MESTIKRAWRTTRARGALLGYLRPSSDLANHAILFNSFPLARLEKPEIGFRHGVSTSACGDAALPALAPRIQEKRDVTKNPRAQAKKKCVWTEASGESMEPIHGPRDEVDWLHP